jgi:hypothetical protein
MEFLAECVVLGTGTVLDLIRESDPNVILALRAVNVKVAELHEQLEKRLAQRTANELAKVLAQIWK